MFRDSFTLDGSRSVVATSRTDHTFTMSAFATPLRFLARASRTGAVRCSLGSATSARCFSLSRSALNSSLKDAFYTTPSTLDTQGSVLGEPTAKTVEKWQAGLWERLEAEMQSKHELRLFRSLKLTLVYSANPKLAEYLSHQQSTHRSGALSMTDLLSFLARDPSLSLAFNYASLLLNTSFFLEGLVKDTSAMQEVPGKFQGLEDQLVAQARGMVGNGWLWVSVSSTKSCCQAIETLRSVDRFVPGQNQYDTNLRLRYRSRP